MINSVNGFPNLKLFCNNWWTYKMLWFNLYKKGNISIVPQNFSTDINIVYFCKSNITLKAH